MISTTNAVHLYFKVPIFINDTKPFLILSGSIQKIFGCFLQKCEPFYWHFEISEIIGGYN